MEKLSQNCAAHAEGAKECAKITQDAQGMVTIPYFVHESEVMRMERHNRRLLIALIVAILCILASNAAWLWYINQYDFVDYEYQQDGEGVNIIGDRNEVSADGTEGES